MLPTNASAIDPYGAVTARRRPRDVCIGLITDVHSFLWHGTGHRAQLGKHLWLRLSDTCIYC